MKNLIRWIIVGILLIVIIFLFINLFNRSKQNSKKVDNTNPPIVYENSKEDEKLIVPEKKEEPIIREQIVEVQDTASFSEISVYIGVFTIAAGVYYLKLRKANI